MITAYAKDDIVLVQANAPDQWGEPSAPTEITKKARVDMTTRLVRDFKGEEVTAAGTVLMKTKPGHDDKVRIDGEERAIIGIAEQKMFSRISHYEVYLS